jgi:hypothetical protein
VTIGPIHELLRRDHARLAGLLESACPGGEIDVSAFEPFRAGLLRHIGMEEKMLLPALKAACGPDLAPLARQMKLDHSALAALLVPTPTRAIVDRLERLLDVHNEMEEGEGGVYDLCERLDAPARDALLAKLRGAREVKLAPYQDGERAMASIERLLRATGRGGA